MKTKLIILGCGSSVGVPRIDGNWGKCKKNNKNTRTRCSAIIVKGNNNILIDASPDIKSQLLSNKIKNISSVLFTHEHADQTSGIFELRPFYWKNENRINIYANSKTIKHLKKAYNFLFKTIDSYYPAIIKANLVKSRFSLGIKKNKINFKTFTAKHGKTNTVVYIFEKTAYISDTNDLSIINMKTLKNLNYLILDCFRIKKHETHLNFEEALFIHEKLKPGKTILTNLHHDLDYDSLLRKLPKNIYPAYDGLNINL
tara:strand:+ start:423 stop:1193 length:771 start_codon:yes stop_codon:yes gene_type:complete